MKFVLIFGPQAVGKMTVGESLAEKTGLKLFHNHMTIELVSKFFSYGTDTGRRLVASFREQIFDAVLESDLKGLIFTYVWAFNYPQDWDYVLKLKQKFESRGAQTFFVELAADLETRVIRNRSEHRLLEKPTKRNVEWSEKELISSLEKYRLNSLDGEITFDNYMKIDNTNLSADDTADAIIKRFGEALL